MLGSTDKTMGQLRPCLEGNTHRLADVGNRGNALGRKAQADNSLEGFTSTFCLGR